MPILAATNVIGSYTRGHGRGGYGRAGLKKGYLGYPLSLYKFYTNLYPILAIVAKQVLMFGFATELCTEDLDDTYARLTKVLVYKSDLLDFIIRIPVGFITDFSSVPRVPIAYWFWGGRSHKEAVLHDFLYRIDSIPVVSFSIANKVFKEAMESRGKSFFVRWPMFVGTVVGGWFSYHKHKVMDSVEELKK